MWGQISTFYIDIDIWNCLTIIINGQGTAHSIPRCLLSYHQSGVKSAAITKRCGNGALRGIAAELLYKYCDVTQREIGTILGGIDYGAVHQLLRRVRMLMVKDSALRAQLDALEKMVKNACRKQRFGPFGS